jgi:hypothetical protein
MGTLKGISSELKSSLAGKDLSETSGPNGYMSCLGTAFTPHNARTTATTDKHSLCGSMFENFQQLFPLAVVICKSGYRVVVLLMKR